MRKGKNLTSSVHLPLPTAITANFMHGMFPFSLKFTHFQMDLYFVSFF